MKKKLVVSLMAALPICVFAYSGANPANPGPPIRRTGLAADGGGDCSGCHRTFAPANSDPRGSVAIDASGYQPGVKQTIKVTVSNPDAARFGFQITARLASDLTKQAGTFTPNTLVQVKCDPSGFAPCNGAVEFAEHVLAQRTDAGVTTYTYSVDWTPPATDVGPILLSAAGNAANGDGTPNGDHIYTTTKTIDAPCALTGKPTVKTVTNGASFAQGGLGPNSLISIFGSNFASTKRSASASAIRSMYRSRPSRPPAT